MTEAQQQSITAICGIKASAFRKDKLRALHSFSITLGFDNGLRYDRGYCFVYYTRVECIFSLDNINYLHERVTQIDMLIGLHLYRFL